MWFGFGAFTKAVLAETADDGHYALCIQYVFVSFSKTDPFGHDFSASIPKALICGLSNDGAIS